jgi:hypothetical protein
VRVSGVANRDVRVERNVFYDLSGSAFVARMSPPFVDIHFEHNLISEPNQTSCLITHDGAFDGVRYANNEYAGSVPARWFCTDHPKRKDVDWPHLTGETVASLSGKFQDPGQNVARYAAEHGGDLARFLSAAKDQSRLTRDEAYSAVALRQYVKQGFSR